MVNAYKKKPGRWMPGLLPAHAKENDDGQGTNHHGLNYHRPRINQPALNEKEPRPQGAGAQLVQGQRVWPGTFGRKSTPAWATTPLNVTRY